MNQVTVIKYDLFFFSGEDRAADVENNTEIFYSDGTPQTNAATSSAGLGLHPKAVSLTCQFCALKVTSGHKTLALHYASQHRDKLLPCKECSFFALSRRSFAEHSEIHGKYSCNKCDYVTTTAWHLNRHKESVHEGIMYPCSECNYAASQRGYLKKHMESKHKFE